MENKKVKLGALWARTAKSGQKYLNGEVEIDGKKTKIVIYKNGFKEEDRHPDYVIYLSEAPVATPGAPAAPKAAAPKPAAPAPKRVAPPAPAAVEDDNLL